MPPLVTLPVILLLLTPAFAWSDADTVYPANPALQSDPLIVAGRGVTRYDRATGRRVWSALQKALLGEPLVTEFGVIVGGSRRLFLLDTGSGRVIWQRRFQAEIYRPVLLPGQLIVTDRSGAVHALSIQQGALIWEENKAQGWLYPPAVDGRLLITGGQDRVVLALDSETGTTVWQREVDQELLYSPLATGGGVVVTTFSGDVLLLNSSDGSEIWRASFNTPSLYPSMVDQQLLLAEMDGTLRALDPVSGRTVWQQALPSRLIAPVSGQRGLLLATVDGGEVVMLDSASGEILNRYPLADEAGAAARFEGDGIFVLTEGRNESGLKPVYLDRFQNKE